MKKILIGVDGSDNSKKAAKKAAELLDDDVEITLVNVIETAVKEEHIRDHVQNNLEEESLYFKKKGLKVDIEIHYGHPAEMICEIAEKNNFDLIVLADKREGIKRFFLGSTSDKVVRHAKTSVLIIK
jgi:nucleotide-binding universal stress UspA family protein